MTIAETLLRRPVGRLAVSLEMILVLAALPLITYALARAGVDAPVPMMVTGAVMVFAIGFYVRALRLDEDRP